jgi:hypothetical protein
MGGERAPKALAPADIEKRIAEFDNDQDDVGFDRAVAGVFNLWRRNSDFYEILAKVSILNQLYNTNIRNPYPVVSRIMELKIDDRLGIGDPALLVDEMAAVKFSDKTRRLFSFATKYCAWHQPDRFQIFDRYVERVLWEYRGHGIAKFHREELRSYGRFAELIDEFRVYFKLERFSPKQLDKFLWKEGKAFEQQSTVPPYSGLDESESLPTATQSDPNSERT